MNNVFGMRFKPRTAPSPSVAGVDYDPTPSDMFLGPRRKPAAPDVPGIDFSKMKPEQLNAWIQGHNQRARVSGGPIVQMSQTFNPDGSTKAQLYQGRLGPDGIFRGESELGELPGEGGDFDGFVRDPVTGQMVSKQGYRARTGMAYGAPPMMGMSQQQGPQQNVPAYGDQPTGSYTSAGRGMAYDGNKSPFGGFNTRR